VEKSTGAPFLYNPTKTRRTGASPQGPRRRVVDRCGQGASGAVRGSSNVKVLP
jgi:hypothetical protein